MPKMSRIAWCLCIAMLCAGWAHAQWTWSPQTGRWINIKRLPKETAELQLEHARSLMMAGEYRKAWRETNKFDEFYEDDPLADENQFLRGEIRMGQGNWKSAANQFQQVIVNYPDTELYEETIAKQYEIGDMYYEKGQARMDKRWRLFRKRPFKRAIDVYGMVVENQPFTAAAAEAQYKIGLSHFARKEYVEAGFEYRRVVEDYAGSDWVDEASYGLAETYYAAAHPPAYDQTPSQLAIEAIDSFAQRYPGDERVAALQDNRAEMRNRIAEQRLQTARFYEKRRRFESARIYYELLVADFSDTPFAEEAQTWLNDHPVSRPADLETVLELREENL